MKKTILAALIAVMIATPCFAQEVVPESLFSIEGTLWNSCSISAGFVEVIQFIGIGCGAEIGFYQGTVYLCRKDEDLHYCSPASDNSSYANLLVVSTASAIELPGGGNWIESNWGFLSAIMQPIGLGVFTMIAYSSGGGGWVPSPQVLGGAMGIMFKINDNWTPQDWNVVLD